jgi:hypothetical protein
MADLDDYTLAFKTPNGWLQEGQGTPGQVVKNRRFSALVASAVNAAELFHEIGWRIPPLMNLLRAKS